MKKIYVMCAAMVAVLMLATPVMACELTDRCDFTTGGGWFLTSLGGKATFAASGGFIKDTHLWGHLEYQDHQLGLIVHGTSVTDYDYISPTTRRIEGTATINGYGSHQVTYVVLITDNGEPGRHDVFSLTLSNGYKVSGYLRGGNFEIHHVCRG